MQVNPPTLAAIGALVPDRTPDAGNSTVAALGAGGAFPGVWTSTRGFARADIALAVAAATNLIVEHSDQAAGPAEAALTETWSATGAHPSFPTALPRLYYRVRLLDTGGGGAVTLVTTLDPRPVDRDTPLNPGAAVVVLGAGSTVLTPIPLGGRFFEWYTCNPGDDRLPATFASFGPIGNTGNGSYAESVGTGIAYGGTAGVKRRIPQLDRTGLSVDRIRAVDMGAGADCDYYLFFYP